MKSDMENNEWADKEMSFEQVSKNNPFTVPSGYFEEAGQRILSIIKLDELKTSNPAQGFTVPENYFDGLTANIQSSINIQPFTNAELPGFAVPQNYFEQLTNNIQSRINVEEATGAKEPSFAVPAGYFENLTQQIESRVAVEEILADNTNAFTAPDGYFEKLNKSILNKTVNQDMVVRKTIVRKMWASNTFKYATAACLALIVGAGVFLRDAGAPVAHTKTYLHSQVADIPVDEIKSYLELNIDANDTHGLMDNDKQINTEALDADLQDYIDIN